jgi:cation transport ATPase
MDEELEYYENMSSANNYCILQPLNSSFLFLTNVLVAFYFNHYIYAFLFLMLTLSSIIHHSSRTKLTNIIDKIALYSIIFYGGYIFFSNLKGNFKSNIEINIKTIIKYILIVATFLSVGYLYTYGYLIDDYVFNPECKISQQYHCLMHLISSIGHHIIISL